MPRTDFTDAQKAQIFVRDRALCAFSGVSLWLLDSGASGDYPVDWVDHVKPACGGGPSVIDNGICASWLYNCAKGRSPYPGVQLFCKGQPTRQFFLLHHCMKPKQIEHLNRFSKLHVSDWFFNRAIWHITLGLDWLVDSKRAQPRTRSDVYYSKAALKTISTWRKLAAKEKVPTLEKRGLVPKSMHKDQTLMLSIRECETAEEIADLMRQLLPFHTANQAAFDGFLEQLYGNDSKGYSWLDFLGLVKNDPFITPIVRDRILANASLLLSAPIRLRSGQPA